MTNDNTPGAPDADVARLVRTSDKETAVSQNFITPTQSLFVISHLGQPAQNDSDWTLTIEGLVKRPETFKLSDLARFRRAVVQTIHQCAGNPMNPSAPTWNQANLVWEGVWLHDLLEEVSIKPDARFVWGDGADSGSFAGTAVAFYRKDIPLARVVEDVLLATALNGAPLPIEHGGPLRLVVPGYYGTNSVKWLWRLTLANSRADSLFTTRFYNDPQPDGSERPVWAIAPGSIITAPIPHANCSAPVSVHGWAWGDQPIVNVEVSDDDGQSWQRANVQPRHDRSWQAWSLIWWPVHTGPQRLICRAINADGVSQPLTGARNAAHSVEFEVRAPGQDFTRW